MRTCLITIGDELLSGRTINTNASYIGSRLAESGAPVTKAVVIGDIVAEIEFEITEALFDFDVVVITGGLGPTHDDVTLDGLAEALELPLEESDEVLETIEARYRKLDRVVPAGVRRMARVPRGATVLPNRWGTAPGLHIVADRRHLFVLPGVPREMRGLLDESVVPMVKKLPGLTPVYVRSLLTAGVTESALSESISDLIPPADSPVRLAFLPGYHGVELRLATQSAPKEADRLATAIAERIGPALLEPTSGDDLLGVVGNLLRYRKARLATAESCTGGFLGKLLTDRAGSSEFYLGGVIAYANSAKQELLDVSRETLADFGSVSPESAAAMAQGARERFGADYALAITGIAGPGGGTEAKPVGLIYLGLASGDGVVTRKLQLTSDREQNRERSAYAALDFLRRHLVEYQAK